mgnify:CR=1 FL=1
MIIHLHFTAHHFLPYAIYYRLGIIADGKHPAIIFRFQFHAARLKPRHRVARLKSHERNEQRLLATRKFRGQFARIEAGVRDIATTAACHQDLCSQSPRAIERHNSKRGARGLCGAGRPDGCKQSGRAGTDDVPDPAELESVFEEMADLVGSAPFAIKTTEGHHFRRVLAQRGKGGATGRQGMRAPLGIRDGRGVMFISHTGEVSPSGFLPMICGNVRETTPAEIYREHPLFISLRDSDALGGKCGECEFRTICGGSRSRAYGLTGDPFAADPACVYQPRQSLVLSK